MPLLSVEAFHVRDSFPSAIEPVKPGGEYLDPDAAAEAAAAVANQGR